MIQRSCESGAHCASVRWTYLAVLLLLLAQNQAWAGEPADTGSPGKDPSALMEMDIEDLTRMKVATVTGASGYLQKVTEAPAKVTIVTADEIKHYGYRTLADILQGVGGFNVTNDRNYSYAGIRGFNRPGDYNSRILLMVNGHRMNDSIYHSAPLGTEFPFDVDLIDRVEIIRGPGSSLYGSNAFFGVVNIITRTGKDVQTVELSASAGSRDTYQGRLSAGTAFSAGPEVLLSGTEYRSDGHRRLYYPEFDPANPVHDPRASNNGIAENGDADGASTYFSRVSFRGFTLDGLYGSREKHIPTAPYGTVFNDPTTRSVDERGYLDLKYARHFGPSVDLAARVYYDAYKYLGYYLFDYPPLTLNRDDVNGRWWGGQLQLVVNFSEQNKLTAGYEYRSDFHQVQVNYDVDPYALYLDNNQQSRLWAVYLQDEYQILPTLLVNAGVRYDHYSSFGGSTNPRLALIYRPVGSSIFKFIYGEAFRAPSHAERSSPGLRPEEITTYELVFDHYYGNGMRSSLSGFYYRISGLISNEYDPVLFVNRFMNFDNVEAKGAEAELEGKWSNGVRGRISYTLQQAEDAKTGQALNNSPQHLAKLNVTVPLIRDRLSTGVEAQYTGRRKTLAGAYTDDFVLCNLTIYATHLAKGLDLSASIYNVFDANYSDPGATQHAQDTIEQDGRTFRVKLTYSF